MGDTLIRSTSAWCNVCEQVEHAAIVERKGSVYMERFCSKGVQSEIIAESYAWYAERINQPHVATTVAEPVACRQGCPLDCGPCEWHSNGLRLPVFSITNDCNLDCPKCFTFNRPDQRYYKSVEETRAIIRGITKASGGVQLINLTGGEPTLHPELFEIIEACKDAKIKRITMNTNGIRIAQDFEFAQKIKQSGVQLVLNLDTLNPETSVLMYGKDITDLKLQALATIERLEIPTTILLVAALGVNEKEVAQLTRAWIGKSFVRSITIQNMTFTGKNGAAFEPKRRLPIDQMERLLCEEEGFDTNDFFPLGSYHPLCYSVAYYVFYDGQLISLAKVFDRKRLSELTAGNYLLEPDRRFSMDFIEGLNRMWAENVDESLILHFKRLLREVYSGDHPEDDEDRRKQLESMVKMVYIHPHMDADNFDLDRISRCGDLVPDEEGNMIPACSYNLLYRQKDPRFWVDSDE
ncbi:MAG: radical SAM protein [Candidatus Riflebacteria bacterium]|nr:radical SAM protein [Candidatus Riflebacteria bacterium]